MSLFGDGTERIGKRRSPTGLRFLDESQFLGKWIAIEKASG